jgi:hypothetical protein
MPAMWRPWSRSYRAMHSARWPSIAEVRAVGMPVPELVRHTVEAFGENFARQLCERFANRTIHVKPTAGNSAVVAQLGAAFGSWLCTHYEGRDLMVPAYLTSASVRRTYAIRRALMANQPLSKIARRYRITVRAVMNHRRVLRQLGLLPAAAARAAA